MMKGILHRNKNIPTIDLHGFTREQGIRRLTDFLEENKGRKVKVITGTGSHSENGPVLRTAVEKLLERRLMKFKRETPGSFIVEAGTGITFFPEPNLDTKVVIGSEEDENVALQMEAQRSRASRPLHRSHSMNTDHSESASSLDPGPTVQEVVEAENALNLGREVSMESFKEQTKIERQEREELKRALKLSAKQAEEEKAREEELVAKVIALSQKSQAAGKVDEEELLMQALEESKISALEENYEDAIQEAISRSLNDIPLVPASEEEEEERILQQVLAMSLKQEMI